MKSELTEPDHPRSILREVIVRLIGAPRETPGRFREKKRLKPGYLKHFIHQQKTLQEKRKPQALGEYPIKSGFLFVCFDFEAKFCRIV